MHNELKRKNLVFYLTFDKGFVEMVHSMHCHHSSLQTIEGLSRALTCAQRLKDFPAHNESKFFVGYHILTH